MSECNYFLASSPRHVLLFAGLALEHARGADNRLFFIEHVPAAGVEAYLDLLRRWPSSPFSQCERLQADYRPLLSADPDGPAKRALKRAFRAHNRARLDAALVAAPAQAVYVGCDTFYESQYLLHRAKRLDARCRGVYVEDGLSAYEYSYHNPHLRDIPKEYLRALRYFPWWRPTRTPGTSGWLSEGYVAFPDLVIDKLRRMKLTPLPRARFVGPEMRELAALMATSFGVDTAVLASVDVLVAITNSKWARLLPGYRETMRGICTALLGAGQRVALKPHPREVDPDPLGLPEHPDLLHLPSQAMFEMLVMLAENPDLLVLGDASTSLVATRWLEPHARIVALRHDPGGVDGRYLERIFAALEIRVETEPARIPEYCRTPMREPA